ncbi:MAG: sulfite exporter TauE/SafE family protein [Rugosibacter sp.]|nr:sulfite exporter TauE/SafE family protein [Rugosibacter sp.]
MEFTFTPALSFSGLIVGLLVGLTGVGGGSLMTPILVLLFGFKPATAVGTDLLYAAITKSGGTWVHHKHNNIDWSITGHMALGSVPAAAVSLYIISQLGIDNHGTARLISAALGVALLLTASSLLFRQRLLAFAQQHIGQSFTRKQTTFATIAIGAVVGGLVAWTSVGAGALGVTALTFLYPKMPTRRVVGSDIAHAVPLTLVAGMGHWYLGSVDVHLLLNLLIGSLPGIALGSHFAARVPERRLRTLLAAVLILVGGKLIFA